MRGRGVKDHPRQQEGSKTSSQVHESLTAETAAVAKFMATELSNKVANTCLQFFGG